MAGPVQRERLDNLLVKRGLAPTRARARDLIKRGHVRVEGVVAVKPGHPTAADAAIAVSRDAGRHVSRGAEKLVAALDAFGFDPKGLNALDIGASAGGFTQVLLERGATRVTAVDVGRGQFSPLLANDPRVTLLEETDARSLSPDFVPDPVNAIVADVSFISVSKALPAALGLAGPGCWLVVLVKPQFEAGPEHVGKGGIVRDGAVRQHAVETVRAWLESQPGWAVFGVIESPIKGGDGNVEFLLGAQLSK